VHSCAFNRNWFCPLVLAGGVGGAGRCWSVLVLVVLVLVVLLMMFCC
jgi:hypothetical protein